MGCVGPCVTTHEFESLGQIRAAFALVLFFRLHAQRLAEILVVTAPTVPVSIDKPVVAFHKQRPSILDHVHSRLCWRELHC